MVNSNIDSSRTHILAQENKKKRLESGLFTSQLLIGACPRCGSYNVHDCQAPEFELVQSGKKILKMGSECEEARKIDDITVGHCDDCGYLWCLECESELSIDNPVCGHWAICDECEKTFDIPSTCSFKEKVEKGEMIAAPCLLDCPDIQNCMKCPFTEIKYCSKIARANA